MLILQNRATSNQYLQHAMNQARNPAEFAHGFSDVREIMEHPVCNRCERVALRTQGWRETKNYVCPNCGDKGRATAVLRGYLKEKSYK